MPDASQPAWSPHGTGAPAVVYLGLGSNLGDRRHLLAAAMRAIARIATIDDVAPVYASAPVGFADQPDFWNTVVRIRTALAPEALLEALQAVEAALGRTPTFRNGPRLIDIDILLHDELVRATPPIIPHPRMHERAFVLRPLTDLDPCVQDPRDGARWVERLDEITEQRIERVLDGALLLEDE